MNGCFSSLSESRLVTWVLRVTGQQRRLRRAKRRSRWIVGLDLEGGKVAVMDTYMERFWPDGINLTLPREDHPTPLPRKKKLKVKVKL
ncbi:hypothetical pox protein [Squirrelpox virus]|uniref:A8L n=1 Tax=Squirrelpox virus TaxID=240426 RepID=Q1HTT6_9POXV|nr:hypothetical pox protein [Squirrelpox virus]ABD51450.1 A8L [Squirrelpox virus]CCD83199.1 hypothetical pox protein [Squirrelpox virus]